MKVYLVMEWSDEVIEDYPDPHIEVVGIFSTEEKAIRECLTTNHFYGEFELDKAIHEKAAPWPISDPYPIK